MARRPKIDLLPIVEGSIKMHQRRLKGLARHLERILACPVQSWTKKDAGEVPYLRDEIVSVQLILELLQEKANALRAG